MEKQTIDIEDFPDLPVPRSLTRAVAREAARIRWEESNKSVVDALLLLRENGLPLEDALGIIKKLNGKKENPSTTKKETLGTL